MPKVIDAPAGECPTCATPEQVVLALQHSSGALRASRLAANTEAIRAGECNVTAVRHAGSARRAARREAATPYKGDGQEGGIIARMLNEGADGEHVLRTEDLEARAESEAQGDAECEGEDQDPSKPDFAALTAAEMQGGKVLFRRVPVPAHRFTPLKEKWMDLYQPIVKHMKLQIRMNLKTRSVEMRTSEHTEEVSALQKSHDFIRAFLMGFEVQVCKYVYTKCIYKNNFSCTQSYIFYSFYIHTRNWAMKNIHRWNLVIPTRCFEDVEF